MPRRPIALIVLLALGFLVALVSMALVSTDVKPPARVPRIGFLGMDSGMQAKRLAFFLDGMRTLGYVDGQNIVIEYRWAEGQFERLPALAAELAALPVDILVTAGPTAVHAVQQVTAKTPIVAVIMLQPVELGIVASLAHPGGNITGQAFQDTELSTKRLQLLKEAVPSLTRLMVLWEAGGGGTHALRAVENAAKTLAIEMRALEVREPQDLHAAMSAAKAWGAHAVLQLAAPFFTKNHKTLTALLATNKLPASCETRMFVVEGCLMAYGASFEAMYHCAAYYVDRILKGTAPASLPIEQPKEFEFVVNRTTAQALGLTLPSMLLVQTAELLQ